MKHSCLKFDAWQSTRQHTDRRENWGIIYKNWKITHPLKKKIQENMGDPFILFGNCRLLTILKDTFALVNIWPCFSIGENIFSSILFHLKEIQCVVFYVDSQTYFSQASKNASNLKIFSLSFKVFFAKDQQASVTSVISGVISCCDLQQLKEESTLINLDTIHMSSEVLRDIPGFLNNFK